MSEFDNPPGPPGDQQQPLDPQQPADPLQPGSPATAAPRRPEPRPLEPGGPTEMLDQRVVVYWVVSGLVSLIVPLLLLLGGTAWASTNWPGQGWLTILAASLAAAFLLAITLISPPLAYARWRFCVDEELLLARYGIIWIEEKSIPISRLQHVDVLRGPIERLFGLATLLVFTAGTEGAHFRLPGLAVARARQLRDLILSARGDDVV